MTSSMQTFFVNFKPPYKPASAISTGATASRRPVSSGSQLFHQFLESLNATPGMPCSEAQVIVPHPERGSQKVQMQYWITWLMQYQYII